MEVEYTLLVVDNQVPTGGLSVLVLDHKFMPIEFEEYKPGEQMFSPTGRPLGRVPEAAPVKNTSPILQFLIKIKIAKNEDYAKLVLLIIIIIAFALAVFYGYQTYQDFHPDINTAPIDLNQIDG